jgi:hypothetical protein
MEASTDLADEIRVARWNDRGATVRSLAEGGRQERVLAAGYREDANRLRIDAPRTAKLLDSLADGYERDASEEDRNASTTSRVEGVEHTQMTGLDTLVAMKLAGDKPANGLDRVGWLADALQVPRAEIVVSLAVLEKRRFFRGDGTTLNALRLRSYLLQDPPPFPLLQGVLRDGVGLPTAHSGPALAADLFDGAEPFVMPLDGATTRGKVVAPIHPRAPLAAARDPNLHALLSLLDALRVAASPAGTARDRELGTKRLLERL